MSKTKALVLLSGGLDSMLAAKLLIEQGIEVVGVCLESNFFNCGKAKKAVKNIGIELKIIDISKDLLRIVKNPPSGYGKHLNPCIDCHSMMIKKGAEIAKKEGYHIIATGEVLGQRPFSQHKEALARVVKLAGNEILRPLSAKLLPEIEAEKKGSVNRVKLLDISGRSRERQIKLAKKYNLTDYATPAGGCLLTDSGFCERLMKMLDWWPECTPLDVELLKYGRVFWLKHKTGKRILVVVGRHKEDNENLERVAKKGDFMLELKEMMGPTTIIRIINYELPFDFTQDKRIKNDFMEIYVPEKLKMSELKLLENKDDKEILNIAALLTGYYATKARGKRIKITIKPNK